MLAATLLLEVEYWEVVALLPVAALAASYLVHWNKGLRNGMGCLLVA